MKKELKYFGEREQADLKTYEIEKLNEYKTRFNKWHSKQIDLLTFSINLSIYQRKLGTSHFLILKPRH